MIKLFVYPLFIALLTFIFYSSNVSASIPGDATGDGVVDGIDYVVWLNNYNKSAANGPTQGDFNNNGFVDGIDYVVWLNNYGNRATTTPSVTIQPSTIPLTPTPTNSTSISHDQLKTMVLAYKAAHPGNGGKDWDINAKTAAQIASDPAAQILLSQCGPGQRPVYPHIAWEYGGQDHPWINPDASALLYCVYIPVNPQTSNWSYVSSTNRVTANVYIKFPAQNPCKNEIGKNQVLNCLGDPTNSEVLVDTASFHDGHDVGLELMLSTTELFLILSDGTKVQLLINI